MRRRSALMSTLIAFGQAFLIAACLYVFLRGWDRDIRVPLHFSIDSLIALAQSKSTVDNGWWFFNPMLGAPSGFDALAFPANSNVDQAVVWTVSWLVPDAVASINLAWALILVLSGMSATWCMRRLGASVISSVVAGTLFALSPYALYRHIGHFWLVTYLVPFVCTVALLLSSGRLYERGYWKGSGVVLLLGWSALLGFNYVYYAFFGCFFVVVGSVVGFLRRRDWRALRAGILCVLLIASGTLVNLAPSLYSWGRHGRPTILHDKAAAESEVYGLKIRQLVSPAFEHSFPPFRWWEQKESAAQFPLETENAGSRLGAVGTAGFLGLLVLLFAPGAADRSRWGSTLLGASQLTLAALLLATIGGFGSLFSLLISPEIRAWNRITPFIAFFSLTAVALTMDAVFRTRERRIAAAIIVLALGLGDQRMATHGLNAEYAEIAAEMPRLRGFVSQLENRLPDRAMVLQLPFRPYLYDAGVARMKPYDHFKPYMVSHRTRWSYPALSNDQVRWQQAAARLAPRRLASEVATEGFAAILIDRYGYDDNGAAVTSAIRADLAPADVLAETDRYVALDIRSLAGEQHATASVLSAPLAPATRGMAPCGDEPLIGIDSVGGVLQPGGGSTLRVNGANPLRVSGWAVDRRRELPAWAVDVVVDEALFPSFYGSDRGDVAKHFNRPAYVASGFAAEVQLENFAKGQHAVSLRVVAADGTCYYQGPRFSVVID